MGTFIEFNGERAIPEDKRTEFNENMIKLLQHGGMMTFSKLSLYDIEINLISPVVLDKEGECYFHYNYFEDDSWESAGFNSNENRLWSNKVGWNEFNFVMAAGYCLTELYSEGTSWVSENGVILNSRINIQWINNILDKEFSLEKRFELWKLYEAYIIQNIEYRNDISEIDPKVVFDFIPKELRAYMGGTELADIFYIANGTDLVGDDESYGLYAKVVAQLKAELDSFYTAHCDDGKEIIWSLIKKPLEQRRSIKGTEYDLFADYSTRVAARVFVYLSAEILNFSFWDEWLKIRNDVYNDEVSPLYVSEEVAERRKKVRSESLGKVKTSQFLLNNGPFTFNGTPDEIKDKGNYYISDDDLMYWWDGTDNIQISEKMNRQILSWKKEYDEILRNLDCDEVKSYNMLKNLINILYTAEDYYERIFAFTDMFYDFLDNGANEKYIAAAKLFERIVEDKKEEGKIIHEIPNRSWDILSKNVTFNEGRVTIKRFLSLMANKSLRKKYFDF